MPPKGASCACSANEPLVQMLRSLEQDQARRNPASKFRFTIARATKSLITSQGPIMSGKDAMKLPGIGAYLGAKIDSFLLKAGASAPSQAGGGGGEAAGMDVAQEKAELFGEDNDGLVLGLEGLEVYSQSQSSVASAPPSPARPAKAVGGKRRGAKAAKAKATTRPQAPQGEGQGMGAAVLSEHSLAAANRTPERRAAGQKEDRPPRGGGGGGEPEVIVLSSDEEEDDQGERGSSSVKPTPKVGRKRKVPATPIPAPPAPPPPAEEAAAPAPPLELSSRLREVFGRGGEAYEAVLLLDTRERGNDVVQSLLVDAGVRCEVRQLVLGDMLWVARRTTTTAGGPPVEYVMRHVIERKTGRDLANSIMDGRYAEQKFRLCNSELDHPIYLVEGSLSAQDAMDSSALARAAVSTQVLHGLSVVNTRNLDDTAAFLRRMHTRISHNLASFVKAMREDALYENTQRCPFPPQRLMAFPEFVQSCRKAAELDVRGVFGRQLRQISGLSSTKAEAILEAFPTPVSLVSALASLEESAAVGMLQGVHVRGQGRPLGQALARAIYRAYGPSQCEGDM